MDFTVLCPEQLPNAIQGEPYSATATFNLPPSVVDPGSGLEATLLTVTISQVTGLPFGLEFSPNNPDGVYQPGEGEYYGCSVVCGTPLVSGSFFVDINVSVLVSAFGFQQTVNESFSLPLVVEPGGRKSHKRTECDTGFPLRGSRPTSLKTTALLLLGLRQWPNVQCLQYLHL